VTTGPSDNQLTTRTWSATDDCGNTATATQTILLTNDNIAPLIANVPPDITIEGPIGSLPGGIDDVTVSDNLDDDPTLTFSEERTSGTCCYVLTRRWTATDFAGNVTIAEQLINVVDTQVPVITGVLADVQSNCSAGNVPLPQLTATDNCTVNPTLQFQADTVLMACGLQVLRTWTAQDECGNTTVRQQTIRLEDIEGPTIDPAAEINLSFFASQGAIPAGGASLSQGQTINANSAWSIGNQPMPKLTGLATDNCTAAGEISFKVANILSVNNGCEVLWTVSFEVLDACGNAAAEPFSATASFVDDKAPTFVNTPQNLMTNCGFVPGPASVFASDETSTVSIQFEESASTGCPKVITRTWTATDACGNSTIAQQQITVVDNLAPVIANVPASTFAPCGNVPPVPTNITATDFCAGVVPVLFQETVNATGNCSYSITRTWMATDNCGNSTVKQQYIWVADNTPPAIAANLPAVLTVSCDAALPPAPTLAVSDNCDDSPSVSLVEEVVPGSTNCSYSVLRKWTVTDHCGNKSFAQQTIQVVDNTLPTLASIPVNITVYCGSIPPAPTVLAGDNCDSDVEVNLKETYLVGCPAKIFRTWKAIDNCGNEVQATQTITVIDDQQPLLSPAPADMTVSCGQHIPTPAVLTAYDLCGSNSVPVAILETRTTTPCGMDILRTWTATDACGNASAVSQVISVVDDAAPAVAEPADMTVNCGELPLATVPAFHDECDASLSIHFTESTAPTACGEDVLRTWTATDDCGNSKTVDQLIHVTDLEAPVLSFQNPALAGLSDGDTLILGCGSELIFHEADVLATDDCSNATVQMVLSNIQSGNCAVDGYLIAAQFKWTAVDGCGNAADLTLNVRLVDNEAPVFEQIDPTVVVNCGEAAPDFIAPAVAGDCSEVAVSFASQTVTAAYGQDIVGTWTATDACGNATTTTQTMQVYSIGAAQIVGAPADLTVDLSMGETVPNAPHVTAIDNCSGDLLSFIFEENSHKIDGCNTIIERTWSAVGLNGVTVSATQTISVIDKVVFTASSIADSCYGGNGSVVLTPAHYDYHWADPTDTPFATGATQNGLASGIYQVTVTNANGCSLISDVLVEAACDCLPATLKKLITHDTKCGEAKGKATILLNQNYHDYSFAWTPDLGHSSAVGNGRTQIPAGHYEVRISFRGNADCVTNLEFDIDDDCPMANDIALPQQAVGSENEDVAGDKLVGITANNLMTPDGDGQNDYLIFKGLESIPTHELRVFNSLGQLVFRTKQYSNNWGGSWGQNNIPSGTYFYLLEDGKGGRYSGHIQILR
jgi:large repetitive protein